MSDLDGDKGARRYAVGLALREVCCIDFDLGRGGKVVMERLRGRVEWPEWHLESLGHSV